MVVGKAWCGVREGMAEKTNGREGTNGIITAEGAFRCVRARQHVG